MSNMGVPPWTWPQLVAGQGPTLFLHVFPLGQLSTWLVHIGSQDHYWPISLLVFFGDSPTFLLVSKSCLQKIPLFFDSCQERATPHPEIARTTVYFPFREPEHQLLPYRPNLVWGWWSLEGQQHPIGGWPRYWCCDVGAVVRTESNGKDWVEGGEIPSKRLLQPWSSLVLGLIDWSTSLVCQKRDSRNVIGKDVIRINCILFVGTKTLFQTHQIKNKWRWVMQFRWLVDGPLLGNVWVITFLGVDFANVTRMSPEALFDIRRLPWAVYEQRGFDTFLFSAST